MSIEPPNTVVPSRSGGAPPRSGEPGAAPRAAAAGHDDGGAPAGGGSGGRVARNTAVFSIATGLSRVAGLVREIVAARYFGTTGPASAFTIAFQVPNLVRGLFADAALSAAFVPVFTELLEQGRRREAAELAARLLGVIVTVLGAITAVFILGAGVVMPLFTGQKFTPALTDLTVGLSRVLFPIVLLLGVNGLVVGILNAYGHFSIPALAPLVWNVVIIVALVVLRSAFHDQIYAYAVGVLIGTVVQLALSVWALGRIHFRLRWALDFDDPRIKRIFALMLPVTIGLGVINFDLLINSSLGTLVSESAPRAIDAAFRIYMLPQGMFSVAVATVLFPALSRYVARRDINGLRATTATGTRQIFLLLIPAAAATLVLAEPITRLIYQRGAFTAHSTHDTATALFWFSFSLPFAGVNLLLTRTFFSLQRPWIPTALASANLVVNAALSLALYKPLGIAGLVIGTAAASAGMTVSQAWYLRRELDGRLDGRETSAALVAMTGAAVLLGAVAYAVWWAFDALLGRGLLAQLISVGGGLTAGAVAYGYAVTWMGVREAHQIRRLLARGLAR
jgi:putative peptidoglycan lipid II flippase